jgi:uncharacterized protein (DUF2235 family)
MSKRIVFCADGTWDDTDSATNVYLMNQALKAAPGKQQVLYNDGVGADRLPIEKLVGGAFGIGLFERVKRGYGDIALAYDQGDEVVLFGFSRGAYTARSIAGMITAVGLPTRPLTDDFVDVAFQAYRDKTQRAALVASLARYGMDPAKVAMLGVWDTVGSLGIPSVFGLSDPLLYGFLDTSLHPNVVNAYQALAIDEHRLQFPPTLWTSAPAPGQTIEQVWFAGVHSDVGGSYPETSLSDITLSWMMAKAKALGIEIEDGAFEQYQNLDAKHAVGTIHESWSPIDLAQQLRGIDKAASVANSVAIRCAGNVGYQPQNLDLIDGVPAATYQSVNVVELPDII